LKGTFATIADDEHDANRGGGCVHPVKRFTDAGRRAIADDNLYAALSLALTMPDICGSLEDPGPGKSRKRYIAWCKKWLEPRFTRFLGPSKEKTVFISAEHCWQLRCALIHSGQASFDDEGSPYRFEFFDKTIGMHLNTFAISTDSGEDRFLQIKADLFSEEVFKAADEWDTAVAPDANVQAEKAKLLTIRSSGFTVGGVQFGSLVPSSRQENERKKANAKKPGAE